jgi:hypothetical protein
VSRFAVVAFLAFGLAAGCATVSAPPDQAQPAPPSLREELTARHNARADELERRGDLQRALQERKITLTITPDDRAAREGRARLQTLIAGRVLERVQQSRAALGRGSHAEARRYLLAALVLDPTNRQVFEMLQQEVREVEVIMHTVRAGETLGSSGITETRRARRSSSRPISSRRGPAWPWANRSRSRRFSACRSFAPSPRAKPPAPARAKSPRRPRLAKRWRRQIRC